MFLHVWLKRQEQRIAEVRVLAQGLANAEHLAKAFQEYINTIYPFAKDATEAKDADLKKAMEKEVMRGPLTFTPAQNNILKDAAKKYSMSNEDLQKLRNSAGKRKGLK